MIVTHPLVAASLQDLASVTRSRRARAAARLAEAGRDVLPDLLAIASGHPSAYARAGALEALARGGGRAARRAAVQALRDRAMLVRLQALLLLDRLLWHRDVEPELVRLLRDGSGGVRINAIDVLARHRVRRGVRALVGALQDDKWYVRQHAARALGELGAREARRALERALDDPRKAVREAARNLLRRILER